MKKYFIFILIVLFSVVFIACEKEVVNEDNKEVIEEKEEKESKEESIEEKEEVKEESKEEEKEESKEEDDIIKNEEVFKSSRLGENIDKYISLMPIEEVREFMNLSREFKLQKDENPQRYTGIIKERYVDDHGSAIRIPKLYPLSDDMKFINQEIATMFDKENNYYHIDYDAYIYGDILSIVIKLDYNQIVRTYNIDISSDSPKLLIAKEMFSRIGVDENKFSSFLELYVRQYLEATYPADELSYYDRDQEIQDIIKEVMDSFYIAFQYDSKNIHIYKSKKNRGYEIEVPYLFYDHVYLNIGLAPSIFEMAVLSKPYNAIGFLYKPNVDVDNIPKKNHLNEDIIFHNINPDQSGESIYFMTYPNDSKFSDGNTYTELSNVEYNYIEIDEDTNYFVKKIIPKEFSLENTDKTDLYLYHTLIPEGMPFEAISMDMGSLSASNQIALGYDGKYGDPVEYVYGAGFLFDYELYKDDQFCKISIKPKREFVVSGDWKDLIGINITKGMYTNDNEYYYLYPSKEDRNNGASEVYIFKISTTGLRLVYGTNEGNIDAPEIPIVATGWYDDEY